MHFTQVDDLLVGDIEGDVLECDSSQVVHLLLDSNLVTFKSDRGCDQVGCGVSSSFEFNFFSVVAICT